jgi:Cullin protein neddylation domain
VEASIVRVMKARKRLSHNDLVAEISRQLSHKFIPSPQVRLHTMKMRTCRAISAALLFDTEH